jgi:hypothetical protein
VLLTNIYTSTYTPTGIYIDNLARPTSTRPSGINIVTATLQGHDTAIYARDCKAVAVTGLYTENCVVAIKLGDRQYKKYVAAFSVLGGNFLGPKAYHPRLATTPPALELSYCFAVSISGAVFSNVPASRENNNTVGVAIALDLARKVVAIACDVPGSSSTSILEFVTLAAGADPESLKSLKIL